MINDNVAKVLNGYLNLSATEKEEFMRELNKYRNSTPLEKPDIEKEIKKGMSVGPKNTICSCCGR